MNRVLMWVLMAVVGGTLPVLPGDKDIARQFSRLGIEDMGEAAAPPFQLITLKGDTLSPTSFDGRLLILHFWATWCVPCRTEMPELQELSEIMSGLPIVVAGIAIDEEATRDQIPGALQQMEITFPIAEAAAGEISKDYWTWGIPVTYLINNKGRLLGRIRGTAKWTNADMLDLLNALIAGESFR